MSEMQAGRELDALVAEKAMGTAGLRPISVLDGRGWRQDIGTLGPSRELGDGRMGREAKSIPAYSTDIAATWEVVERMRERGLLLSLSDNRTHWRAAFDDPHADEPEGDDHEASTAALAICLAALNVFGGPVTGRRTPQQEENAE